MIEVKNLYKSFGAVKAVSDLSFSAQDGAITSLLGANGSGKSTTLRAICGVMKPDQGGVLIDGLSVADNKEQARNSLGVFTDQFGLYPRLTTREHLEYFGRFHGLTKLTLQPAIERTSALLEMNDILERRTEGFSQGQRMKVALARTLIHSPRNLILDEPTRGLDVMSTRLFRRILKDLRTQGCCVLFSSHVMAEVQALSDQVVMIAGGKLLRSGTPAELIQSSQCETLEEAFVAFTVQKAA